MVIDATGVALGRGVGVGLEVGMSVMVGVGARVEVGVGVEAVWVQAMNSSAARGAIGSKTRNARMGRIVA